MALEENAKVDWMKVVKKHKKNQKGLALSTLNTDAGDVETSINMFNMMQPSVDSMGGCAESLEKDCTPEPTKELCSEHADNASLDDKFDMSLRTLL